MDSRSPVSGAYRGALTGEDQDRALTPGFSGKKELASDARCHPDYLAYQ